MHSACYRFYAAKKTVSNIEDAGSGRIRESRLLTHPRGMASMISWEFDPDAFEPGSRNRTNWDGHALSADEGATGVGRFGIGARSA
jgi:hypothetical protein